MPLEHPSKLATSFLLAPTNPKCSTTYPTGQLVYKSDNHVLKPGQATLSWHDISMASWPTNCLIATTQWVLTRLLVLWPCVLPSPQLHTKTHGIRLSVSHSRTPPHSCRRMCCNCPWVILLIIPGPGPAMLLLTCPTAEESWCVPQGASGSNGGSMSLPSGTTVK